MPEREVKIEENKMSGDMTRDALDYARIAYLTHSKKFEIAKYIKEEFDLKYKKNWTCIVGTSYSTYFLYESSTGMYIRFYMGEDLITLYKPSSNQ